MKSSLRQLAGLLAIVGILSACLVTVKKFRIDNPATILFGPILIAAYSSPFEPSGHAFFQNSIGMFLTGLVLSFGLMVAAFAYFFKPGKITIFISIASAISWPIIGAMFVTFTKQMHR